MDSTPFSKNELVLRQIFEILSSPSRYFEAERYQTLSNYNGDPTNPLYFDLLLVALNDPSRNVRMLAAHRIIDMGRGNLDKLLPALGEFTLYRRKYIAYILGFWFPEWKRVRYYEILRQMPLNKRTIPVEAFSNRILVDSDANRLFDAIHSLELIGDFRAISLLKHAGKVLRSQIEKRIGAHDDYSIFLVILYFLQHPVDNSLKRLILTEYLGDLFRICQDYEYSPVFEAIFNELNLIGSLVMEVLSLNLSDKILRTLQMRRGSWAYSTMLWVLTVFYPSSVQVLEEIKKNGDKNCNLCQIEEICEDILANFKINLNSGLNLFL